MLRRASFVFFVVAWVVCALTMVMPVGVHAQSTDIVGTTTWTGYTYVQPGSGIDIYAGGTLNNSGGTWINPAGYPTFNGAILDNNGTVNNSGTLNNTGLLRDLPPSGTTSGGTLNNYGALTESGNGQLANLSTLNNYSGGSITVNNSGNILGGGLGLYNIYGITVSAGGTVTVNNSGGTFNNYVGGTITVNASGGLYNGAILNNYGTVNDYGTVYNRTSAFVGPVTQTEYGTLNNYSGGSITVNNSGAFHNYGGTLNNSGAITVTDSGTLYNSFVSGGSATLNNHSTVTVTGTGSLQNSGTFNNYGTLNNSWYVRNDVNETSSGVTTTYYGTINNYGTVVNSGVITPGMAAISTINNYATIQNNSGVISLGNSVNSGALTNDGGVIVNLGTMTNSASGVLTNNAGTLSTSALALNQSIDQSAFGTPGHLTASSGGTLVNGTAIGSYTYPAILINNGTINGTGTYVQNVGQTTNNGSMTQASVTVKGGTFNQQAGTLTATGTASSSNITNNGTFNYTGGSITANILNNAQFNIQAATPGSPLTVYGSMMNYGAVNITQTTAVFTGGVTNNGTWITDPSTIIFEGGYSGTGTLTPSVGDTYEFLQPGNVTITLNGDATLTGLALGQGVNLTVLGGTLTVTTLFDQSDSNPGLIAGLNLTDTTYEPLSDAPAPTPVPATLLLLAPGLGGLAAMRRRIKK